MAIFTVDFYEAAQRSVSNARNIDLCWGSYFITGNFLQLPFLCVESTGTTTGLNVQDELNGFDIFAGSIRPEASSGYWKSIHPVDW